MTIEIPAYLQTALERYIQREDRHATSQQVVEAVLRDWAVRKGLLEPHENGGTRPDDLSSENDD